MTVGISQTGWLFLIGSPTAGSLLVLHQLLGNFWHLTVATQVGQVIECVTDVISANVNECQLRYSVAGLHVVCVTVARFI